MSKVVPFQKQQARKLQATLVRNYDPLTHRLTGVRCRATSVAKNEKALGHSFQKIIALHCQSCLPNKLIRRNQNYFVWSIFNTSAAVFGWWYEILIFSHRRGGYHHCQRVYFGHVRFYIVFEKILDYHHRQQFCCSHDIFGGCKWQVLITESREGEEE